MNINVLGEAVLGDAEADERLERVLEMLRATRHQLCVGQTVLGRESNRDPSTAKDHWSVSPRRSAASTAKRSSTARL